MTTPEQWQRANQLFDAALEQNQEQRAHFIDHACGAEDPEVRRQLEALLRVHRESDRFMETPAATLVQADPGRNILSQGQSIGRYRIERLLGAGGMGEVYLAEDPRLGRKVALKLLPKNLAADTDRLRRFELEARTASSLSHPNVCVIYEIADAEPQAGGAATRSFIAMEHVPGESLRQVLDAHATAGTRMAVGEAIRIALQMASGLEAAHAAGVVHRDIKPENVMIRPDGLVKILDFGLAKLTRRGTSGPTDGESVDFSSVHTQPGMVMGTIQYMSPEQAGGESLDARTDVWSLGAVLYEMVAGRAAFSGKTVTDVLIALLTSDPPALSELLDRQPAALQQIVNHALAKDRQDRYQSAAEVATALTELQSLLAHGLGASSGAAGLAGTEKPGGRPRGTALLHGLARRPWVLVAGAVVVFSIAFAILSFRSRATTDDAHRPIDQKYVVAVLPFENLSRDTANGYVAAGMTEEITSQLSQLSVLRVITRAALAPFRGVPERLARMDKELGVGSVVMGSVRVDGKRARIAVQLINARSGQAIWSQQYDRDLSDMLAIENEVGRSITTALEASLTPAEARRAGRPPTVDIAAYELYMRALGQPFDVSAKTLHQAVEADPTFARAYARLARAWLFMGFSNRIYLDSGLKAANKAIALDPNLAYAYFALGGLQTETGRLRASRASFLKAHELDPNLFGALADLSLTEGYLGRYDEALYWASRAFLLAPNTVVAYYHLAIPLLPFENVTATERLLLRAERLFPDAPRIQADLVLLDLYRGRTAAALDRANRTVNRDPENPENQRLVAEVAFIARAPDSETLLQRLAEAEPRSQSNFLSETLGTLYALSLARGGAMKRADSLLADAVKSAKHEISSGDESPSRQIEIAAISAMRGDLPTALDWLERGYQAGYKDYRVLARDPFFDSLRSNPRYQQIVSKMKSDVAAMERRAVAANDTLFAR